MAAGAERDFASILRDLMLDSALDSQDPAPNPVAVDYLAVAEELLSGRIAVAEAEMAAVYRENAAGLEASVEALFEAAAAGRAEEPAAELPPIELPPIEPEAISRELGLDGGAPPADLARLRRTFAFRNHPDRVAPHLRQRAMVRMQVANMLIDDARRRAAATRR